MKYAQLSLIAFLFTCTLSLAQPGFPDTSFGLRGLVYTSVLPNGKLPVTLGAMTVLPDGKILQASCILNQHTAVFKFTADGKPDSSFGQAGIACIKSMVSNDISITENGKILIAGNGYDAGKKKQLVVRLHANGAIDTGFAVRGRLYTGIGTEDNTARVISLAGGKILTAGTVKTSNINKFCVMRFLENGNPDVSFNGTGNQLISIGSVDDGANYMNLLANGRIMVGGYSKQGTYNQFAVACLNVDGGLYNGFDGDGILTIPMGTANSSCNRILVQPDQTKIVAAGWASNGSNDDFAVARYNIDGTPDNGFDGDGKALYTVTSSVDVVLSAHIGQDDKISLVGYSYNGSTYDFSAMRILAGGGPDPDFDGDGKTFINFLSNHDVAITSALLADGSLLLGGYSFLGSNNSHVALAKLDAGGALINSFGSGGKFTSPMSQSSDNARGIALQADGKLLVCGETLSINAPADFAIIRYNANGLVDPSFGNNGRAITSFNSLNTEIATAIAVQKDGRIVAAGDTYNGSIVGVGLLRLLANGTPDNSFDGDGKAVYYYGGVTHNVADIKIQEDGKIVLAVYSPTVSGDFKLLRFNEDGSPDNSFDGDGMVVTDINASSNDVINSISIQPDGKIVAAGFAAPGGLAVVRYTSTGALDNSFSGDGKLIITDQGVVNCEGMALQTDGKIVMVGNSYNVNNNEGNLAVLRLNTDGTPDAGFGTNGISIRNIEAKVNGREAGTGVAILPNGKIVVGGVVSGNSYSPYFAQFNANGTPDYGFGTNGYRIIPDLEMPDVGYPWNNLVVNGNKAYWTGVAIAFDQDFFIASVEVGPIAAAVVYRFVGNGNFSEASNWLNNQPPPNPLPSGAEVIIDPAADGQCTLNVSYQVSPGGKFSVVAGKRFIVPGVLNMQ